MDSNDSEIASLLKTLIKEVRDLRNTIERNALLSFPQAPVPSVTPEAPQQPNHVEGPTTWPYHPTTRPFHPVQPVPPSYPAAPGTFPEQRQCAKCGISLSPVMSYSCPEANCPCGLGSPFCMK